MKLKKQIYTNLTSFSALHSFNNSKHIEEVQNSTRDELFHTSILKSYETLLEGLPESISIAYFLKKKYTYTRHNNKNNCMVGHLSKRARWVFLGAFWLINKE